MIGRKRGRSYPVYVYDSATKQKKYVGSCEKLADAKELERDKEREYKKRIFARETARSFADRWLDEYHGERTRRPAPTTYAHNQGMLKPFLKEFGDRYLSEISRREALAFARKHPNQAKTVSAMYSDALDEVVVEFNPFANRRQPRAEGRRHITPLTEAEIERLGEIAVQKHAGYGRIVRAWIFFGAWVGARPGEYFALTYDRLDLDSGLATITRVKGRKQSQDVVVPEAACQAIRDINAIRRGLVFPTPKGALHTKGSYRYYWAPVRDMFAAQLKPERWQDLLGGRVEGQRDVDLYELRHFGASIMADRGLTEYDIAHQLGNSPEVCRETYIHTHVDRANDRIRTALDAPIVPLVREQSSGANRAS